MGNLHAPGLATFCKKRIGGSFGSQLGDLVSQSLQESEVSMEAFAPNR